MALLGAVLCGVAAPIAGATSQTPGRSGMRATASGRLIAVGDSIMLGAKTELAKRLEFLQWPAVLDMEVSRSTSAGATALAGYAPGPADVVVVSFGANDSGNPDLFRARVQQLLATAGNAGKVLWLTIPEARPYYSTANDILREVTAQHTNAGVIEWAEVVGRTPGLTARDGLHLTPEGSRTMADMITAAALTAASALQGPETPPEANLVPPPPLFEPAPPQLTVPEVASLPEGVAVPDEQAPTTEPPDVQAEPSTTEMPATTTTATVADRTANGVAADVRRTRVERAESPRSSDRNGWTPGRLAVVAVAAAFCVGAGTAGGKWLARRKAVESVKEIG